MARSGARSTSQRKWTHKFHVSPPDERRADGWTFHSKKEMRRYQDLKRLQLAGEVAFFLRQVPFHFIGGEVYRVDFVVYWADGDISWEDVKGHRTKEYLKKKRRVEEQFPIRITEI